MVVTLVQPYNSAWPQWFDDIRRVLEAGLDDAYLRIEHVGSTSIPGMIAKPIIDIDIVIAPGTLAATKERLERLGYVHEGDQGIPTREAFDLADEALKSRLPKHHLYVCAEDSPELARHIAFREFLKRHPEYRDQLGQLKWALAEQFDNDKYPYMDGKAALVREIIALAQREQG